VTVRLHARPEADESIAIPLDDRPTAAPERVRQLLRRLPFAPYVCEVVNDTFARHLGIGSGVTALVRMGGNRESVVAQRAALTELGDTRTIEPTVWAAMRASEAAGSNVLRLSRLPSEIGLTWSDAQMLATSAGGNAFVHATPSRGIVRCILPKSTPATRGRLRDALSAPTTATRIGERLEGELWDLIAQPHTSDSIAARVRSTFDPRAILNPGILGAAT
jgi:hypothetical protein